MPNTPTPGTDDDDAPTCAWCWDAHVARAELRPLAPRRRTWRMPWEGRPRVDGLRVLLRHEGEGREAQ